MPHRCCVPDCKSNSPNEKNYASTFFFPKDPTRKSLWCKNIHRKNFVPTSTTSICVKHFHGQFLKKLRHGSADNNYSRIRLTKDAYPSIFPDLPKYLFSIPLSHSHDPQRRRDRVNEYNEALMKN